MVDVEVVKKVAELARLHLTESELSTFTQQLGSILESFQQMSEVSTEGVEPLVTPTNLEVNMREDGWVETYSVEELVSGAPDKVGTLIRVPPVV